MRFRYEAVERIPKEQMADGVVYHSEEFELAGLRCACGCGHRITLLVPDSHQVFNDGGWAAVRPSIGVFDAPCKSHFIVDATGVEWLPPFSGAEATSIMRAQIARHVSRDPKKPHWIRRAVAVAGRVLSRLWPGRR
jgi:hypothetical protein